MHRFLHQFTWKRLYLKGNTKFRCQATSSNIMKYNAVRLSGSMVWQNKSPLILSRQKQSFSDSRLFTEPKKHICSKSQTYCHWVSWFTFELCTNQMNWSLSMIIYFHFSLGGVVVRYYAESAPSISILSTPMTHSLPGIFLTFPVPAGPRSPNALLNKVKQHYNRSKGGHVLKDTGPVWPALPALPALAFLSAVYRDSECFAVGREPPPHQAPFSTHSCGAKRGAQCCSSYQNASVEP